MNGLKKLRKAKGFSAVNIADLLHVKPYTVISWENKTAYPSPCRYLQICGILDCCLPSLMELDFPDDEKIPLFYYDGFWKYRLADNPHHGDNICDFALEIPQNISDKILKGDICFFSSDYHPSEGGIVLACDTAGRQIISSFPLQDGYQTMAVCISMKAKI